MTYAAPVKAFHYLLRHAVDVDSIMATDAHSEVSHDLISDILDGAASFTQDVLAPLNWTGDQNPAQLNGDDVTASPGFKEAYAQFAEAGWQSLPMSTDIGGMGLPNALAAATSEMIYASNMAFGLCPMLTSSAVKAIDAHASDELKAKYLDKMVTGEWSGAMDLTEPQAGSDLGPLTTKAVPKGDGSYSITGQKIYITWGDHDCADNIIHLVLARLPDAPSGSRGISLFLCPKYMVEDDGTLGARNSFKPIGLEHKLGIHGSPTCVMEFDGATGWLVGEENRGLACMFTMMNEARLFVGVQGVAIGERAYQAALQYAHDRVQGKVINGEAGAPIIGHPDVRRMLIDMKSRLMGARAICMATAAASDMAACAADPDARKAAHAREALLTPIAKAYSTDLGVEVASIGVQVHGGMGFVEETGAAQHYRDARIAPIYEGTNGIQALDLIGRKLRRDGGEAMQSLIAELVSIHTMVKDGDVAQLCEPALRDGVETLKTATDIMLNASEIDAMAAASDYLALVGDVVAGAYLIKAAVKGKAAGDSLADNMQALANYHALSVMPRAGARLDIIRKGADVVFDFPVGQLADL
ncbi:acyl-CoA dehydrogenase [Fretibacter rubidus]|uniref:acyl-CoA dehydrogenase n=1 Tax=Fretibacter rubidus TaxID=570162 RepID=UPI00352B5A95